MNKVLILGINGFSGKHFQYYIKNHHLTKSYEFIGVDKQIEPIIDIKYIKKDLSIYDNLENILKEKIPDYIINLVGIFYSDDFKQILDINANISYNILEIVLKEKLKVKNILLIGSAAEYGIPKSLPLTEEFFLQPVNSYGLSKVIQTKYMKYFSQNSSIPVNMARTFNVIGKNISTSLCIGNFVQQINQAKNNDTIYVGNLDTKRDFLDIADAIHSYWLILTKVKKGEIYNVCQGESIAIKDILNTLIKKSGKKINIKVKEEFLKKRDILDIFGDNSKLKHDTGWNSHIDIISSLNKLL